ncbi:MAG TPA: response regulator transcription factor [Anaerolineales bacterium]|nr:response regulator transcription factor [Anaerolineales bacterium]
MAAQGHVLIVDDEAALRQTLARILQRAGLETTTAASAGEALDYLAHQPFDLVYLDIRMPDMSGLKALKVIHARHADLPVVLFTAQPDISSAVEALREGAVDYLLKPLEPKALVERTQAILSMREKERRKRELQAQIDGLQAELKILEGDTPEAAFESGRPTQGDDRFLVNGRFKLDLHTRRVSLDQRVVDLPPTAFDYLVVLARHAPNIVDSRTLVAEAQGYEADAHEAQEIVKWHVHHIRQALEPDPHNPVLLINVRGAGYRLVLD